MSFEFTGSFRVPVGDTALLETYENQFWFGKYDQLTEVGMLLSGASRDVGNTNYTDMLRPGLLLGKVRATNKIKEWNPTGTDGSEIIYGVFGSSQKVTSLGSNLDRWLGPLIVGGNLKPEHLIIPGNSAKSIVGDALEYLVRAQLTQTGRFKLADQWEGNAFGGWKTVIAKGAGVTAYTVLEAENNYLFTNRGNDGNINFTLPATAKKGLRYGFFSVAAGTLTVTAGTADTMVTFNNAAADAVVLGTTSEIIGGFIEVIGDGTGWLVILHTEETQTLTVTDA